MSEPFAKISLVTPSFNQAKFIEQTIKSILDQGYPNLEYIVIDGGSTDGTVDILKRYADRLQWVSEPDGGQSDGINKGLRRATGDIVGYVNSDDLLLPGSLHRVNAFFRDHANVSWMTGRCRIIDEQGKDVAGLARQYKDFLLRHYSRNMLLMINFIAQMSTFWRRSAYERVGEFSTEQHLVMDYDYWLRLLQLGDPGIVPQTVSAFRLHQDAKSTQRYRAQFHESYRASLPYIHHGWLKALSWLHNQAVIGMYTLQARQRHS